MNKMVALAQKCIGMKESDGSFKVIIDVYNSHKPLARGYAMKYTDAWCATFISYLSIECGYTDIVPTECGCERQVELFKKLGEWDENDARIPNPGDIIYYDWQDTGNGDNRGWSDHVGIVESCDGKNIIVIEGNNADSVKRRSIAVNARYIRGYGVPKYPAEETRALEFVDRLYRIILGRAPDVAGLNDWVDAINTCRVTASETVRGFLYSPEFLRKKLTNIEYVTVLYQAVLGRNPDNAGLKDWLIVLDNGASRDNVLTGFLTSNEFDKLCKIYNIKK